jgi:hypothetical protein
MRRDHVQRLLEVLGIEAPDEDLDKLFWVQDVKEYIAAHTCAPRPVDDRDADMTVRPTVD